jgi:hypothetical protein
VHLEDRDIEGATTEIVDGDDLGLAVLVQSICESGGRRFVNYPENIETSNLSSVLGGLSLGVVEVGRDGDDSVAKKKN